MRAISTDGFRKPGSCEAGAAPMLQWIAIADLVVDPSYQRPIAGKGRKNVDRIAANFSWSCFAPVVVAPIEGGKFVIIDGQHRTTAAALVGIDSVPCQIVIVPREQQAAAFKAINGMTTPISSVSLHHAAVIAGDEAAIRIARVCECANVNLLRYPVTTERQQPGQTLAVGAIRSCLKRFGEETLITALQCVTQTTNNKSGALSALMIKALCSVLHRNRVWRDSGLALFEAFDAIDLMDLRSRAASEAAARHVGPIEALAGLIHTELAEQLSSPGSPPSVELARPNGRSPRLDRDPPAFVPLDERECITYRA